MTLVNRSAVNDLATIRRAVGPWLICACLTACATNPPPEPLPPQAPRPAAPMTVTLIEAGREPRELLRYHVAEGARQTVKVDFEMTFGFAPPGKKMVVVKSPLVRMAVAFTGHPLLDSTNHVVQSKLISCDVVPGPDDNQRIVDALKKRLPQAVGLMVEQTLDDRGFSQKRADDESTSFAAEDVSVKALMRSLAEQTWAPLPVEPVGRGSKWSIEGDHELGGLVVHDKRLVTLEGRAGGRLILAFEAEQSAVSQQVAVARSRNGAQSYLIEHRVKGRGRQLLDLEAMAPTGQASSEGASVLLSVVNDRRTRTTMGNTMKATITREEAPPP
jgi:hypothetical protein